MVKINNKKIKSCILCQNTVLSDYIDPILFNCQMSITDLVVNLQNRGVCVEEEQLRKHSEHIFIKGNNSIDTELEDIKNSSNLDLVKKALANIEKVIQSYIDSGNEQSQELTKLWGIQKQFLEIKSKLEGDMVEKIEIKTPEWISMIPDDEPKLIE